MTGVFYVKEDRGGMKFPNNSSFKISDQILLLENETKTAVPI